MTNDYYINAFLVPAKAKLEKALKEITYVESCVDELDVHNTVTQVRNAVTSLSHAIQELEEEQRKETEQKQIQAVKSLGNRLNPE